MNTRHFSKVASRYDDLRITDPEPVDLVASALAGRPAVVAADVGCGTGRYAIELMCRMGERLWLSLVEYNPGMIAKLRTNLQQKGITRCVVLQGRAEQLPLPSQSLCCLLTFNAVHHFDLAQFLKESVRTLRPNGLLFIYTRLRDQNRRGVWGRFFPDFTKKEGRLYGEAQLCAAIGDTGNLTVREVTRLSFERSATIECLVDRARNRHYSTFCYYKPDELKAAIESFRTNLSRRFGADGLVEWADENAMLTIERS